VTKRRKVVGPLHGARIEDYALSGDCETGALVSHTGSIDGLRLPSFSSRATQTTARVAGEAYR
jgi:GH15 family glucan-1,4-alpha-glucosidase